MLCVSRKFLPPGLAILHTCSVSLHLSSTQVSSSTCLLFTVHLKMKFRKYEKRIAIIALHKCEQSQGEIVIYLSLMLAMQIIDVSIDILYQIEMRYINIQGDPNKMSQNKKIVYSAKKELEVLDKVHLRGDVLVHVWCNLHREWLICACSMIICTEKSKIGFNAISEHLHCQTLFCGKINKKGTRTVCEYEGGPIST